MASPPSALLKFIENVSTLLKCWVIISQCHYTPRVTERDFSGHAYTHQECQKHIIMPLQGIMTSQHYVSQGIFCHTLAWIHINCQSSVHTLAKVMWTVVNLLTPHPLYFSWIFKVALQYFPQHWISVLCWKLTIGPASFCLHMWWPCGISSSPPPL